ncbi:MAG: DUF4350 domain-containing protein [Kangiellaceae bacterium]|nr:DUF4350 domain-containing protein [Kangiellaceae bacterium]
MSNRITVIFIALIFLSIIGFGVYNFYQTHEYKEVTTHTGFRGEARKNPLYATRLFLKRMGINTETKESVQGLDGFPNTDTVLLIDTNRSTLSNKRTLELIDWVKSGGHIIAKTTKDWKYSGSEKINDIKKSRKHSPDPLQRYLGVRTGSRTYYVDPDEDVETLIDEFIGADVSGAEKENSDDIDKLDKISLEGVDKKLTLDLTRYRTILVDEDFEDVTEIIELDDNTFMIRQKVGDGLVTLIADMSFFENRAIEKADHAEILWNLIHGLHKPITQPKAVWLIHNDEMPSLWDILWNKAWAFILSLLFLFAAWLLLSTHRFGPMIPKQAENRRSLNEHISSSGNFYWKHDKKAKLIESSRKALLHRLTRIHPGWEQRTKEEQLMLLAAQTEMKPDSIQQLLYSDVHNPNFEQAETFTQLIKDLEKIRNTL